MNTRILIAIVVSMFLCPQFHTQAEDDPEQAEETELEGTWELVSEVSHGEQRDVNAIWRFEGNRWYSQYAGIVNRTHDGTFSLNPSAMPAEINFVHSGIDRPGIYDLDNDSLTICFGISGAFEPGIRPDVFESSEDYQTHLLVLRRVEDDE